MRYSLLTFLFISSATALAAGDSTSTAAKPKIERIALFKNGLGYATAVAAIPDKATNVTIGQLPVPSYGTFWVGYSKDVKVRHLVTSMETNDVIATPPGVDEMLRLNPGRSVLLHVSSGPNGEQATISGVVQAAPIMPLVEPPSPYFMDYRNPRPYEYAYPQSAQTAAVLIQTERGIVAINPNTVAQAEFAGNGPLRMATNHLKRPTIRMELEQPASGEKFSVSYLARGITWVPSYRIDISDDKTAQFSAEAQIINEMTDIESAQVELVTGFPNIQFPDLPNPVAMSQPLADFLRSLAAGRAEGSANRVNFMGQQQALTMNSYNPSEGDAVPVPAYSAAEQGQSAEDLFLYPVAKFSLKKGETATIPLFSAEMAYRHLYTWKISDQLDGDNSRQRGPEGKAAEEVWHVCRLANSAKMPLTTAVAEFVKNGQFVGQDTCYYTAAGVETSIRINRAMNVQAEQAEVEIERKRNAANFYGYGYDLVKLTGELKIRNRTEKAIDLEISKELSGEVLEKSHNAKDVQTARGLKQVNPKHNLTWLTSAKAGEEVKITYSYQLYVRP
jgi:hypothetical protein